jgi:hypothetical protein
LIAGTGLRNDEDVPEPVIAPAHNYGAPGVGGIGCGYGGESGSNKHPSQGARAPEIKKANRPGQYRHFSLFSAAPLMA